MSNTLDIQLLDKDYKVACPPGEQQALQRAALLLNKRLEEASAGGRFSGERLVAMVALNLAHELLNADTAVADSASASSKASPALDSDEFARRIEAIESRIDAALAG